VANVGVGDPTPYTPENTILTALVPTINSAVQEALPVCYGNGQEHMPSKKTCEPASGDSDHDVFYTHSSCLYKVYAEYIDEVNKLDITSMVFTNTADGKKLELKASGKYPDSALSSFIYIGECFTFCACSKIWANHDNFARTGGYAVGVTLTFDCDNGKFVLPTSGVATSISPALELKESITGISFDVKDLTGAVQDALQGLLKKEMTSKIITLPDKVPGTDTPLPPSVAGQKLSVVDIVNLVGFEMGLRNSTLKALCPPSG